jgi:general nucleoside transport system ATP-binding protein
MVASDAPVVLRLEGITKRFGPLVANDAIGFELRRGEVVALLGENGAGKTTLMNILFGHYTADAGTVEAFGRKLPPGQPRAALAAGICMVHQHFTLADNMSVLENIVLGTEPLWRPRSARSAARARVRAIAGRFGFEVHPEAPVGSLSVGERQRVEILKALYRDARILILDEPTAVLTPQETEALFRTLRLMVGQGLSVVFISHKLGEVMAIAERVLVLRHGRLVGSVAAGETDRAALARMMVGEDVATPAVPAVAEGPVLLALEAAEVPDRGSTPGLRGVDLALRSGRITGLAGVSGNGQGALADVIAGLARPAAGRLVIGGRAIGAGWSPRAAVAAGIARVPEDRHRTGTIAAMSLTENAVLEGYRRPGFSRFGWMDWRAAEAFARRIIADYDVRCPGPEARIGLLSGGNMQKLILGRVLAAEPRIVLANQPTRGLDVGAVAYVHGQLLAGRARGAAVLLISEDLDEIQALADVVHVISAGRLSPAFPRGTKTQGELGAWMAGQGFAHAA